MILESLPPAKCPAGEPAERNEAERGGSRRRWTDEFADARHLQRRFVDRA